MELTARERMSIAISRDLRDGEVVLTGAASAVPLAACLLAQARHAPGLTILERTVNGQPGLIVQDNGTTVTVFAFDVTDDQITRIWAIRNPDKLRPWTAG